jgi:hypothetical protein
VNSFAYPTNPVEWVDPLGLRKVPAVPPGVDKDDWACVHGDELACKRNIDANNSRNASFESRESATLSVRDRLLAENAAVRENGAGGRLGGGGVTLVAADAKFQVGVKKPGKNITANQAQAKVGEKAGGFSIGDPCEDGEIGIGSGSWNPFKWKKGFDTAAVSVSPVTVSANVACVDINKVVDRAAAEFTDAVIKAPMGETTGTYWENLNKKIDSATK